MKTLPTDTSIRDFLAAVASAEAAHGAVSAAAVTGGIGVSLLAMVAALPKTRSDSADNRTELIRAATALNDVQEQLIETIETETAVKIFTARNMPQASDTQRTDRQAAIQLALRAAADVPLEVMRLCALGLKLAEIALLHVAFLGARANLEGKLSSLTDAPYITSVVEAIARLSDETATAMRTAESFLQVPPA
jgi:formiminotetrahydrofolate cyclodeaminase